MATDGIGDWIKKAAAGLSGGTFSGIAELVGKFIPDPTQKAQALKEIQEKQLTHDEEMGKIALQAQQMAADVQKNEDNNITERWKADAGSDNKLSKNARPIVLFAVIGFLFIIIILDSITGIRFKVDPAFVDLIKGLVMTVVIAYFGSRGVEKFKRIHDSTTHKISIKKQ